MNQLTQVGSPPARWRRRLLFVALALVVLLGGGALALYVLYSLAGRELRQALDEADRLDPGWRFEDLEAARAQLPDAENAALQVHEAYGLMPAPGAVLAADGSRTVPPGSLDSPDWDRILPEVPPQVVLGEQKRKELTSRLAEQSRALDAARKLADMPRGRYVLDLAPDYVGTLMPHIGEARRVTLFLGFDALRRAYDGDLPGALVDCVAMLNTARSVGDEPAPISPKARAALVHRALQTLERVLAQGEAPVADLEAVQRLLEEEAEVPHQLIAARAERAMMHGHLQVVRTGHFNRAVYGLRSSWLGPRADDVRDRIRARAAHARYLRYLTAAVEIAKLPPEEQQARWLELAEPQVELPILLQALSRGDSPQKAAELFHANLAELRSSAVAIAVERYRLEEHRWPDTLAELVPCYLKRVPADPFDGQPLRYRPTKDGVVVYTLGPDRKDDGGKLDRTTPRAANTDIGFELWNVERRRQPGPP
jgi:hypothetical protein